MPFQKMPDEATVIRILEEEQDMTKAAERMGVSRQNVTRFLSDRHYERHCTWRKRTTIDVKATTSANTDPAQPARQEG